jgi:hypothetical protein
MNLSLIDPFVLAQDYPESLTGNLRKAHLQPLVLSYLTELWIGQEAVMQHALDSTERVIFWRRGGYANFFPIKQ